MNNGYKHFSIVCFIAIVITELSTFNVNAQGVGINSNNAPPDPSAALDINVSNKGTLISRMTTTQRDAIPSPATGLQIYNTDCSTLNYFNGGRWIAIGSTGSVTTPGAITGSTASCLNASGIGYSIGSVSGATGYNWIVPRGATISSGQGTTSITVNFGNTNGNLCVTASDECGTSNASCTPITLITSPSTSPTTGSHTALSTQITWNWNTVASASGYKYNTINDYGSATNNGTSTTYIQTGLTCNTNSTLYVWAYNACGNSTATILTQTTTACIVSFTTVGSTTWTPPAGVTSIAVLVVAGGGGGGGDRGGGGGAGGYQYNAAFPVSQQAYTVTVGGGGAYGISTGTGGQGTRGSNGGNSVFSTITAIGGGGGGACSSTGRDGLNGGSGGGGSQFAGNGAGGTGSQGSNGGTGYEAGAAGGGGGASAVGVNASAGVAGKGGAGITNNISGSSITYAGGGGGGGNVDYYGSTFGVGGAGGGGAGSATITPGADGAANTGGGGGGGSLVTGTPSHGGVGGSGIVIISY